MCLFKVSEDPTEWQCIVGIITLAVVNKMCTHLRLPSSVQQMIKNPVVFS